MYKIIGADGREYGPATVEQLRRWMAEGRVNAQTRVRLESSVEWRSLGSLVEFGGSSSSATPPPVFAPLMVGPLRKTSGYATAGLICGILSWTFCCCYGMPLNLAGVVLSFVALSQINHRPEIYEGRVMAVTGLLISLGSVLLYGSLLIWALATGNYHFDFNNQFGQ